MCVAPRQLGLMFGLCLVFCAVVRADEMQSQKFAAGKQAAPPVTLSVRAVAGVADREVTVADVATIEGGDANLRDRIAKLDVADAPRFGQVLRVSQELIAYRIQVAGIDMRRCRVLGARSTSVTLQTYEVPEQEIVAAARQHLLARLPWDPEDIMIQLSQPIRGPVLVQGSSEATRFEVIVRSSRTPLGKVRVDVTVLSKEKKLAEVPVFLDVHLYQRIAVSSRRIERGQPLTDDSVYFERRAIDALTNCLASSESPVGQRAKRLIMPLQVITKSDVEPAESDSPVVVKQRDVVKLVARLSGIVITATGEAMQDGREGQMIRVRNIDSKNIVTGRVVNRSEVQVLY